MASILLKLKREYPNISFVPGNRFSWSPTKQEVIYKIGSDSDSKIAIWSLLHEVGHALLEHKNFKSDFELLKLETEAWTKAEELAIKLEHKIDPDHIQDCLDTYRDWLYQRSTCPTCTNTSLQTDNRTYNCFNCGTIWHVSSSRLCRAYRRVNPLKALL